MQVLCAKDFSCIDSLRYLFELLKIVLEQQVIFFISTQIEQIKT